MDRRASHLCDFSYFQFSQHLSIILPSRFELTSHRNYFRHHLKMVQFSKACSRPDVLFDGLISPSNILPDEENFVSSRRDAWCGVVSRRVGFRRAASCRCRRRRPPLSSNVVLFRPVEELLGCILLCPLIIVKNTHRRAESSFKIKCFGLV